jgi:hypothetical protein
MSTRTNPLKQAAAQNRIGIQETGVLSGRAMGPRMPYVDHHGAVGNA